MEDDIEPVEVNEEQREKLIEEYSNMTLTDQKQSLCRYYLRGLCTFAKDKCKYSHGVDDLKFRKYVEGQPIVWKYQRTDYNQSKLIPKEKRYINLYEFQKEKLFTEDQINSDRKIRSDVRDDMIREECEKFMEVLQLLYPQHELSEKFLEREFTRAGFHKPTSILTYKKICQYLCNSPQAIWMASKTNGSNILVRKLDDEKIQTEFARLLKESLCGYQECKIIESDLKKLMFKNLNNPRMPVLNLHLKGLKLGFMDYIHFLINANEDIQALIAERKISFQGEPTLEEMTEWAMEYLSKQEEVVLLDQFMIDIMAYYKLGNKNTVNPVKAAIANCGYHIYYLPMVSFILNSSSTKPLSKHPCVCKMKTRPDLSWLTMRPPEKPLDEVQVIDSNESFDRCALAILQSEVLAIDIEGRLRKGGFIELIQFNNGHNVFLFDIYKITQLDFNFELLEQIKLLIREKLLDQKVLKIFHDSRHDCLSLHEIVNSCTRNVFDTSGMEIFKLQFEFYRKQKTITNAMLGALSNVRTPGLNEILKKYEAPHGINESKDEFHRLMSIGKQFGGIFHQRPLHPQYKKYCVKDVLDLIHVYNIMRKQLPDGVAQFVGDRYVQDSYESTL